VFGAVPGGTEQPVLKTGVFWPGSKPGLAAAERSLSWINATAKLNPCSEFKLKRWAMAALQAVQFDRSTRAMLAALN
jgi:hypothetical protein